MRILLTFVFVLFLSSCASTPKEVVIPRPWQKTSLKGYVQTSFFDFKKNIVIRIWPKGGSKVTPNAALVQAANEIKRVATLADSSVKSSLLAKVNEKAYLEPVGITQEFLDILMECDRMYRMTDGKFDVTFVPYKLGRDEDDMDLNKVTDWDSRPALSAKPIHLFGKKNVIVDQNPLRIRVFNRRTKINLNGMIRGYAMERAAKLLSEQGHEGFAVIADGFFAASGLGLTDPGLMCIENPLALGTCFKSIQAIDSKQTLFVGTSSSTERRGVMFDPTEVWSTRGGGVIVVGTAGAWVQFANTITAVMDDVNLLSFLSKVKESKIRGMFFSPAKPDGLAGDFSPFARISN
jgi:thiamine biosynthesis lipoprotein ApbE